MPETKLKLRSPNYKSVRVTAPTAGYTAGLMYAVGGLVGVIAESATAGKPTTLIYACDKIVVPKVAGSGLALAVGQRVYFRAASNAVTSVSTGNVLCGRCLVAAGALDTEVEIDLTGNIVA